MNEELFSTLIRFHREVLIPDVERIVDERVSRSERSLRNEMVEGFDALYAQMKTLQSESLAHTEGLRRLDRRMDSLEVREASVEERLTSLDHAAPKSMSSNSASPTSSPITNS